MKKKIEREGRGAALGTAIIVIVMVIVFGGVFAWMYSIDLLFLPDFVVDMLGLDDDEGDVHRDLGALSEIVKNGRAEAGDFVTFDVTYENLRAALLAEEPAAGMYLAADISYYSDGEPATHRIRYYRDGDKFRTETYSIGNDELLETLKIGDSENVMIYDYQTSEARTVARARDIDPMNEAGIPSVTELLSTVALFPEASAVVPDTVDTLAESQTDSESMPAQTNDSADGKLTDCLIKLVRTDGGNVYYIAFTHEELGLREEYYLSLEHCLVISASSFFGDVPVYSYDIVHFSADSEVYARESLYNMTELLKSDEEE